MTETIVHFHGKNRGEDVPWKVLNENTSLSRILEAAENFGWHSEGIYQTYNNGDNGHIFMKQTNDPIPSREERKLLKDHYDMDGFYGRIVCQKSRDPNEHDTYILIEPSLESLKAPIRLRKV